MLGDNAKAAQAIKPDAYSAGNISGAVIDSVGYHSIMFVVNAGTIGENGTLNIKVQECDTSDGTFADIGDAVFAEITPENDEIAYFGTVVMTPSRKRYLKLVGVAATAGCDLAALAILGDSKYQPVPGSSFTVRS